MNNANNSNANGLLLIFKVLRAQKKFILINTVVIGILASIIAFLLPTWFLSYAVIRPSEDAGINVFSAMLGAKGLAGIGKNLSVGNLQYSDLDYYKSLLQSRTISLKMVKEFDLLKVYKSDFYFKAIKELEGNTDIQADVKSNFLSIGVFDQSPERAKKMVETYLRFLEESLKEITKKNISYNKEFIDARFQKNVSELQHAEDTLKKFQQKYGVIVPSDQFTSTIKIASELEAKKMLLEAELSRNVSEVGADSPVLNPIKTEIGTLDKKILEFKNNQASQINPEFFVSLKQAPDLINQYIELYRDVEVQSTFYSEIFPINEQYKMAALKNAPVFYVIDDPFVPEYKEKPKRLSIILIGMVGTLLLSAFFVLGREYYRNLKKSA